MNSFSELSVFEKEIKDSFIISIPHSSVNINPLNERNSAFFNPEEVAQDLLLSTDFFTDMLFSVPDISTFVVPFSRLYCDFERFEKDEMDTYGRGLFYTKSSNKIDYRYKTEEEYKKVKEMYDLYHALFYQKVQEKLLQNGVVYIVDGHSFNEEPLYWESPERPDICLGTDSFHTPPFLLNYFKNFFEKENFSVMVDKPYSGAIVPLLFYHKEERVKSIMIEINKKLYMPGNKIDFTRIKELNSTMARAFEF